MSHILFFNRIYQQLFISHKAMEGLYQFRFILTYSQEKQVELASKSMVYQLIFLAYIANEVNHYL